MRHFRHMRLPGNRRVQLENPVRMIERSSETGRIDGFDAGKHPLIIGSAGQLVQQRRQQIID